MSYLIGQILLLLSPEMVIVPHLGGDWHADEGSGCFGYRRGRAHGDGRGETVCRGGRIVAKVINHLGDEVMKVFGVM